MKIRKALATAGITAGTMAGMFIGTAPSAHAANCYPILNGTPGVGFCYDTANCNPGSTFSYGVLIEVYRNTNGTTVKSSRSEGVYVETNPVTVGQC